MDDRVRQIAKHVAHLLIGSPFLTLSRRRLEPRGGRVFRQDAIAIQPSNEAGENDAVEGVHIAEACVYLIE